MDTSISYPIIKMENFDVDCVVSKFDIPWFFAENVRNLLGMQDIPEPLLDYVNMRHITTSDKLQISEDYTGEYENIMKLDPPPELICPDGLYELRNAFKPYCPATKDLVNKVDLVIRLNKTIKSYNEHLRGFYELYQEIQKPVCNLENLKKFFDIIHKDPMFDTMDRIIYGEFTRPYKFIEMSYLYDRHREPWFIGKNIANILGFYKQHLKTIVKYVTKQNRKTLRGLRPLKDRVSRYIMDKPSNTILINKAGVEKLISISRLSILDDFKTAFANHYRIVKNLGII